MEHLSLEIFDITGTGSKYANLSEDSSITIVDTSAIFASGDVWSYSFQLNVDANAHIFGTAGEMHGARLHEQINKRRARLWGDGLPLYFGFLTLGSEAEVDEDRNVEVTFESGQKTFQEKIEGAKANQVPMMGDVMIGVALWRQRKVSRWLQLQAYAVLTDGQSTGSAKVYDNTTEHGHDQGTVVFHADGEDDGQSVQQYPNMVFPKGKFVRLSDNAASGEDTDQNPNGNFGGVYPGGQAESESINCLNTDYPYDDSHPYCNISLCYQRSGYEKKNDSGAVVPDYNGSPEPQRGYEVMPANRINSAPNFFVIYWIRALMKHLGIHIEENQMMDVEDLRRLFFVNTKCAYRLPKRMRGSDHDDGYGRYRFADGPSLLGVQRLIAEHFNTEDLVNLSESGFSSVGFTPVTPSVYYEQDGRKIDASGLIPSSDLKPIDRIVVKAAEADDFTDTEINEYKKDNRYLHDAFATSECFPNVDVSEVIQAIENGFGIRFLFDENFQRVRIILLRNIFRSKDIQRVPCDIISDVKIDNSIRGFRMTYGKTDDTHFYYKGFADLMPHKTETWKEEEDTHDYSHWDLNADYRELINRVSAFDVTCYVTNNTGNAYGIKIDKDAKRYDELHPSLFEYAGFMDAEDGDCTGDEDTITTINVGYTPAIMNDLNMEEERNTGSQKQRFALFVSEQMRPRRPDLLDLPKDGEPLIKSYDDPEAVYNVDELYSKFGPKSKTSKMTDGKGIVKPGEFVITSDMFAQRDGLKVRFEKFIRNIDISGTEAAVYATYEINDLSVKGHINEGYRLYLQDNFEPNDTGVSPIESHDWGLTLGIMRGSGSDAHVEYSADPDDGENNDTWEIVPGSSVTAHPDTCDSYGHEWGYVSYSEQTGQQQASELLSSLGIDPSFASRWRYANPDTVEIEGFGYPHPSGNWGGWPVIFCQDNIVFGSQKVMITPICEDGSILPYNQYQSYVSDLQAAYNAAGSGLSFAEKMLAVKASDSRKLLLSWSGNYPYETFKRIWSYALDYWDKRIPMTDGRISLKLRAEKPNPEFDPSSPDGDELINTKEGAGAAMQRIFTTSNTDLLARPKVSNAALRAAGWSIDDDGFSTSYAVIYPIRYIDGIEHKILWTPIKPDGTVLTVAQLESYVDAFDRLTPSSIIARDSDNLLLDIDTTEARASLLQKLQAIYYSEGGTVDGVVIPGDNHRYLPITNPALRGRGLCDQFYKEYSYWIRNARIAKREVIMELAQLRALDKTKRVTVGDITGFIRKMQYSISNKTGLGVVTMEIMYI